MPLSSAYKIWACPWVTYVDRAIYDSASTMSGVTTGVQAKLKEIQPKAVYTHCTGHALNLSIVSSCSITRNCIDTIKSVTIWVNY